MNTVEFTTNLKCSGCVAQITPFLNELAGVGNWQVNLQDADKTLSVHTPGVVDAAAVLQALEKAGFKGAKK